MKIASRYLIPLELFMAVTMLSWGISGWIGEGLLWDLLARNAQNWEWGLTLCAIGLVQLAVTSIEWCRGRRWDARRLHVSVTLRFWAAFACVAVWLYVCFVMATTPDALAVFSLVIQAPVALAFALWICVGNLKVACVLDPAVPTTRLQEQIRRERSQLLAEQAPAAEKSCFNRQLH